MTAAPTQSYSPRGKVSHCVLAVIALAAACGLASSTVYSLLHPASVSTPVSLTWLSSADEASSAPIPLGTFTTGQGTGNRSITIAADNSVRLAEFGPKHDRFAATDVLRPGHRGDSLFLATKANGEIEVLDQRTLRYFGDIYRRTN